jgi:hypothetical protein
VDTYLRPSLGRNYIFTRRTFGPYTLGSVVFLVFDQEPRLRNILATVWTATECLRVVRHGNGKGRSV